MSQRAGICAVLQRPWALLLSQLPPVSFLLAGQYGNMWCQYCYVPILTSLIISLPQPSFARSCPVNPGTIGNYPETCLLLQTTLQPHIIRTSGGQYAIESFTGDWGWGRISQLSRLSARGGNPIGTLGIRWAGKTVSSSDAKPTWQYLLLYLLSFHYMSILLTRFILFFKPYSLGDQAGYLPGLGTPCWLPRYPHQWWQLCYSKLSLALNTVPWLQLLQSIGLPETLTNNCFFPPLLLQFLNCCQVRHLLK